MGAGRSLKKKEKSVLKNCLLSFLFILIFLVADRSFPFSQTLSWKIYDAFSYWRIRMAAPSPAIKNIVIVGIDSNTIDQMKERWPYSRATFAKVIRQLKQANARAVGLDFSFFGDSTAKEDGLLRAELLADRKVVLGATLKEDGGVQFSNISGLDVNIRSGLVNKLQDNDGFTRRALTYLISRNPDNSTDKFFSWEMQLLEASGHVRLQTLEDRGAALALQGTDETLNIPVDPVTKAFLIRYQAHTGSFEHLSFYHVLTGEFDPKAVEDKIVLIGFLSEMLQDFHRTPVGWLPGITVNANALLTLVGENHIKTLPRALDALVAVLGIVLGLVLFANLGWRRSPPWLALEVALFFGLSFYLFIIGYIWNYALFPLGLVVILSVSKPIHVRIIP